MAKINLRDFYPFYHSDLFIEIPDEVETALLEAERLEKTIFAAAFITKPTIHWTQMTGLKRIFFSYLFPLVRFANEK